MVVALRGTINGNIISFARAQWDRWEAIIPKSLNGAYVVDMSAVDEAGNTAYIARYIITIDISSMCVHIEPCPYYEELLEPQYRAVLEKSEYYVELIGGCNCECGF